MLKRPRVDFAGFHHVINRGSNQANIFKEESDYITFLKLSAKLPKLIK